MIVFQCSTNSSGLSYFKLCMCIWSLHIFILFRCIWSGYMYGAHAITHLNVRIKLYGHGSLLETTNGFWEWDSSQLTYLSWTFAYSSILLDHLRDLYKKRTSDFGWLWSLVIVINLYTDFLPHKLMVQTQCQTSPNHN